MTRVALIGTIEFLPGSRDEVLRAVLAHRERSLRDEPGTLVFEVLVPDEEPSKLLIYEVYADAAAFALHMGAASITAMRALVGSKLVAMSAVRCTLGEEFLACSPTTRLTACADSP